MATSIGRINGIQSRRPLPPTKALHIFLLLRTYFITNPWYKNKIFLNDFAIVNSDFVKENEVLEIKVFLKKRNTLNEQNRRELQFWTWFCQDYAFWINIKSTKLCPADQRPPGWFALRWHKQLHTPIILAQEKLRQEVCSHQLEDLSPGAI